MIGLIELVDRVRSKRRVCTRLEAAHLLDSLKALYTNLPTRSHRMEVRIALTWNAVDAYVKEVQG